MAEPPVRPKDRLTLREACALLKTSARNIPDWVLDERLPCWFNRGDRWVRFPEDLDHDLAQFVGEVDEYRALAQLVSEKDKRRAWEQLVDEVAAGVRPKITKEMKQEAFVLRPYRNNESGTPEPTGMLCAAVKDDNDPAWVFVRHELDDFIRQHPDWYGSATEPPEVPATSSERSGREEKERALMDFLVGWMKLHPPGSPTCTLDRWERDTRQFGGRAGIGADRRRKIARKHIYPDDETAPGVKPNR